DSPYLTQLRTEYHLESVIKHCTSDYEKVRAVCAWVRRQWEHNGDNQPEKRDPISILCEAQQGKQFRCVEYAIVLSGVLAALGITARALSLMTQDVETREYGAGHVATEVYLPDLEKWMLVDGQFDVIPVREGVPLNAVELQQALAQDATGLSIETFSQTEPGFYLSWIAPYLFYFQVPLDNRLFWAEVQDMRHLVLVPLGEKEPKIFQRTVHFENMLYTHFLEAFYPHPYAV
ncbi:MAG TPA: transglutaminase, partial [Ktedonobacter sp.]|nr:transglutaminase [Ktedonobacter sp.]